MWKRVCVMVIGLSLVVAACAPVQAPGNSGNPSTGGTPAQTAVGSDLLTANGDSEQVVAHWQRSGGFAGICQAMDIYADGHAVVSDCNSNRELASGELTEPQRQLLKGLLDNYQQFNWKFIPPKGSADMFVDEYTVSGVGSQLLPAGQNETINEGLASVAQSLLQQPSQ